MKFSFVGFDKNINRLVVEENISGKCLFICPNYRSKRAMEEEYQKVTTFQKTEFITMDEYKLLFFANELPLIKEEKRTLAFFSSLSKEHKEYFHITDYFQSISLANSFFTLFEELEEERVSFEDVKDELNKRLSEQQWQTESFEKLLDIHSAYRNFIESKGFSDLIYSECNYNEKVLTGFDEVIVVNQFYFTKREAQLLPDNTTLYLQLPEKIYNKNTLKCSSEFTAQSISSLSTKSIEILEFNDEFSLKYHLLSQNYYSNNDLLIDSGILRDHLQKYKTAGISRFSFKSSSIYNFFNNTLFLLYELEMQDEILISINSLLNVCSAENYLKIFSQELSQEENILREDLLRWLYNLIDRDYKYIDLRLELPQMKPPVSVEKELKSLFKNILEFKKVTSVKDFKKYINNLSINKILTSQECKCTDLPEVYYSMVEDFSMLDEIGIIDNWQRVFPQDRSGFSTGTALLKLFLNYAKSKNYTCFFDEAPKLPEITSLNNTRNLSCKHAVFIDAIEGNLPPVRQTPFLFTEGQRASLGLKTYSDIVLREKYYFLRMISQSEKVTILTRSQEKDTTEVSSFVEELKLYQSHLIKKRSPKVSYEQNGHVSNFLKPVCGLPVPKLGSNQKALPFSKEADLRNKIFPISPSKVNVLINQPFIYYIENILKLKKREIIIDMEYSPRQLGNIIHEAFSGVWKRLIDSYQGNMVHHNFKFNQDNYSERSLENYIMISPQLKLQIPYNHSQLYFEKIIKKYIADSVKYFLQKCIDKYNDIQIIVLPEEDRSLKTVSLLIMNDINVVVFGKADLRIEVPVNGQKHIYDYKTGKHNPGNKKDYMAQLEMYETLYYQPSDKVQKYIFFVTNRELIEIKAPQEDISQQIKDAITGIINDGYTLGDKKYLYEDDDLTRRSLIKTANLERGE